MNRWRTAAVWLGLGLLGAGVAALVAWLADRAQVAVLGQARSDAIDNAVIPDWVALAALGLLLTMAAIPLIVRGRAALRRRGLERRVTALLGPDGSLNGVHVSDDGRFGYVGIKVSAAAWGPDHPLYGGRTYRTTAGALDALAGDAEYRFPLVRVQGGRLDVLAVDVETLSGRIDLITMATGTAAGFHRAASRLHQVFSDLSIPLLTPVMTAICVFVQGLTRPDTAAIRRYLEEDLVAWLKRRRPDLALPPSGFRLDRIETRVVRAPDMAPITFVRSLRGLDVEAAAAAIHGVRHDFAFADLGQAIFQA